MRPVEVPRDPHTKTANNDGFVSEPTLLEGRLDRQGDRAARSDRRGPPGRRGAAPEEGAARPDRRPDPARLRRMGRPLPRLRLAGRHRSVRLLRRLARLVGGLRANPTLPPLPGHATPRHPDHDDRRDDAGRRVPSLRRRSGSGASWPRSEPSSSSRCVRPSAGSSRSSSSSCSWASRARCCSRTRTSRLGSRARCWR